MRIRPGGYGRACLYGPLSGFMTLLQDTVKATPLLGQFTQPLARRTLRTDCCVYAMGPAVEASLESRGKEKADSSHGNSTGSALGAASVPVVALGSHLSTSGVSFLLYQAMKWAQRIPNALLCSSRSPSLFLTNRLPTSWAQSLS